jgi:hypothetical protein
MNLSRANIPLRIEQSIPLKDAVAVVIHQDYRNLKYPVMMCW